MALSQKDVDRLLKDTSPVVRQEVMVKIVGQYNDTGPNAFSTDENEIVEVIFRTLMKETGKIDREVLAEKLQECKKLPKDIVLYLAQDGMPEVAGPMLRYSPVLEEKDLIALVEGTSDKKRLLPIAQRDPLVENVSSALLAKKLDAVTMAVLKNTGSQVSDKTYMQLLKGPKIDPETIRAIMNKGTVSVAVAQRILMCVEGDDKATLDEKYEVRFENKQLKRTLEKKQKLAAEKMAELRSANKKA